MDSKTSNEGFAEISVNGIDLPSQNTENRRVNTAKVEDEEHRTETKTKQCVRQLILTHFAQLVQFKFQIKFQPLLTLKRLISVKSHKKIPRKIE